ncbi:MAG: hypothetical protein ACQESR_03070 [Planctomycetota bacterium]
MLEYRWQPTLIQVTFSAKPRVSPVFLTPKAKGRLQHALRVSGSPTPFCPKGSVETVGDNTNDHVESYTENQVVKQPVVDERFRQTLPQFTVVRAVPPVSSRV